MEIDKTNEVVEETTEIETTEPKEKTYTQSQLTSILKRKEAQFLLKLSELEQKLTELSESKPKEIEDVEKYKNIIKELKQKEQDLIKESTESKINAEVMKFASKSTKPDIVAKLLKENVRFVNNEILYNSKLGIEIELNEGFNELMEDLPEFLPSPAKPGSGSKHNTKLVETVAEKKTFKNTSDYTQYLAKILKK